MSVASVKGFDLHNSSAPSGVLAAYSIPAFELQREWRPVALDPIPEKELPYDDSMGPTQLLGELGCIIVHSKEKYVVWGHRG